MRWRCVLSPRPVVLTLRSAGPSGHTGACSECARRLGLLAHPQPLSRRAGCVPPLAPAPRHVQTPHMNASHWRKSNQFFGLTRRHAELVLADTEAEAS